MAENEADDGVGFKLRSYQQEMLEASLKQNIIVKVTSLRIVDPVCPFH